MAFTVTDFDDLVHLLAERPEWQAELRRLILSEDFLALPRIVQELAEAQQRTEVQVRALVEAQQRTDERLQAFQQRTDERLEAFQQRTDERFQELATEVRALAEAQRRTDERLEAFQQRTDERLEAFQRRTDERFQEVAEAQRRTDETVRALATEVRALADEQRGMSTSLGKLQRAFGANIEEEAESNVQAMLEDKGYRLLAEPYSLALDGELDVVMELEAPSGETVCALVEAKARLGHREVRAWAQRMKSSGWQQSLADSGVPGPYLVYAYGIRVDAGAVRAAEAEGIGLATGRGERVAPRDLIRRLP